MTIKFRILLEKATVYPLYFAEDLLFGDLRSVVDSLRYVFRKKLPPTDRVIHSRLGKIYTRALTTDFMYANYAYEFFLKKFILKHINQFEVFFDVGSCIGEYAVWLNRHNKQSVCFEPVTENRASLLKNLELNGISTKVKVMAEALGAETGTALVHVQESNKGASSIQKLRNTQAYTETIQISTLDLMVPALALPADAAVLMKIDAEGMELDVIRGATAFIKSTRQLIIIYEVTHVDREAISNELQKLGRFRMGRVDSYNCFAIKLQAL